jgi:hypothetical protein
VLGRLLDLGEAAEQLTRGVVGEVGHFQLNRPVTMDERALFVWHDLPCLRSSGGLLQA